MKIVRNSWVKNNKKQKKSSYNIFFVFYCFLEKNSEVKLTIIIEPNIRFEWNKKHMKEKNLAFHIKTSPKKPFTYMIW